MSLVSAIIVAGGSGHRMRSETRKQYLKLGGLPILSRTIAAIDNCSIISRIFLVIPAEDFSFCKEDILKGSQFRSDIHLVSGGKTRQESVYNGLAAIPDPDGVVLIHDGVRPFVTIDQINQCIRGAQRNGACILGIPVNDTIKQCDDLGNITKTVDRDSLWFAQTPQAFRFHLIKRAHDLAHKNKIKGTDDASLLEFIGERVSIIRGSIFNIKITTPEDLSMAEAFMNLQMYEKT